MEVCQEKLKRNEDIFMSQEKFVVQNVRSVTSPADKSIVTYFIWVDFNDLPETFPTDVNPRKPKMTTSVAKALLNAVADDNTNFDINNRGMVITAKSFVYDTSSHKVTLDFGDETLKYGLLDGGHTYRAIIDNRGKIPAKVHKYVRLEIIVGHDLDVVGLADARNTSVEVSDIALYELDGKFEFIKEALKNQSYANDVGYKDNDPKRVPVVELLKLLFSFNINKFKNDMSMPVQAYSGKSMVFKDVKNELDKGSGNIYQQLAPLLPDLVSLYELIESDIPQKYKDYKTATGSKARFGHVRGIEGAGSYHSPYTSNVISYSIASGYIMPIFGAFRALLEFKDDSHTEIGWRFDPKDVWEKVGSQLVQNTFETNNNPQLAGKDSNLWRSNYRVVDSAKKDLLIQELTNSKH